MKPEVTTKSRPHIVVISPDGARPFLNVRRAMQYPSGGVKIETSTGETFETGGYIALVTERVTDLPNLQ
jgi:hypothetical protein